MSLRLTIIESPYAGDIINNCEYAQQCCRDSWLRGETPFATHLFCPTFLNETNEAERQAGIEIGYAWGLAAKAASQSRIDSPDDLSLHFIQPVVAFYVDKGWSPGMEAALKHYTELGMTCEVRRLINSPES